MQASSWYTCIFSIQISNEVVRFTCMWNFFWTFYFITIIIFHQTRVITLIDSNLIKLDPSLMNQCTIPSEFHIKHSLFAFHIFSQIILHDFVMETHQRILILKNISIFSLPTLFKLLSSGSNKGYWNCTLRSSAYTLSVIWIQKLIFTFTMYRNINH